MAVGEYVSMAAQVELLQRLLAEYRVHMKREPEAAREDRGSEEFIRRGGVMQATAPQRQQARFCSCPTAPWPSTRARSGWTRTSWARPSRPWPPRSSPSLWAPWCRSYPGSSRANPRRGRFLVLGGAAALLVGGALGFLGGRNVAWSAARQLLVLVVAAGATWGAGKLFDVTVT